VTDEKGKKMLKELIMIALLHVTKMMHIIFYTSLNITKVRFFYINFSISAYTHSNKRLTFAWFFIFILKGNG